MSILPKKLMNSVDVLEILRFLFEFAIALIIKYNINWIKKFYYQTRTQKTLSLDSVFFY